MLLREMDVPVGTVRCCYWSYFHPRGQVLLQYIRTAIKHLITPGGIIPPTVGGASAI
jgi:hypothetical protein